MGSLYLLPVSLGDSEHSAYLPAGARDRVLTIDYFVVENAKTARAELKRIGFGKPLREVRIEALPPAPDAVELERLLEPILAGKDAALMSEAGCPAVADPGALLVRAAHQAGIRVVPLVGPSSLLLALMASGLNGQSFAFCGYLPIPESERSAALHSLERESADRGRTQIFIETPYRNARMFCSILAACRPDTRLCVATDLTSDRETIATRTIADWRRLPPPAIDRRPTVFLLLAERSA